MGVAWAWHATCELALSLLLNGKQGESDHILMSSAELKAQCTYTFTPLYTFWVWYLNYAQELHTHAYSCQSIKITVRWGTMPHTSVDERHQDGSGTLC